MRKQKLIRRKHRRAQMSLNTLKCLIARGVYDLKFLAIKKGELNLAFIKRKPLAAIKTFKAASSNHQISVNKYRCLKVKM